MNSPHYPVLKAEILENIPDNSKLVLDCTMGWGGHASALLDASSEVSVFGVDRDPSCLEFVRESLVRFEERLTLVSGKFSEALPRLRFQGLSFDYIIADLGVSSPQLDKAERGFSFRLDGPLDMRMDSAGETTAEAVVNGYAERDLARIFSNYGEEKFASRIAGRIVGRRKSKLFRSTVELAEEVKSAIPKKFHPKKIHPATKVFQALRIEVNEELQELDALLEIAPGILKVGGRLAVISFHSLEDRKVKRFVQNAASPCGCPPDIPRCVCGKLPWLKSLNRKPITAREAEIGMNPRSRSAKLRIAEKIR